MKQKTVFITGGNAGIGKATATALARGGARVLLGCRDPQSGEAAATEIRAITGNPEVGVLPLDLADLASVSTCARAFRDHNERLDVLINNAGVFSGKPELTADGFELQFGVNHLGHFLFTLLLLPALQAAEGPRVVNVASVAYLHGKLDFDELRGASGQFHPFKTYARSKLANVLFTREFARRYPGIDCNCLHPGVVRTLIGNKHSPWYLSLFWSLYKPFMNSPEQGAQTSIYLASAPEVQDVTGAFFDDKQRQRSFGGEARNDLLAHQCWQKSLEYVEPWL